MGKHHKKAGDGVDIVTALPATDIARHAKKALDISKGSGLGKARMALTGESADGLTFAVQNILGMTLTQFRLTITDDGSRRTAVAALGEYTTSQTTVYFIPIMPKTIEGYSDYMRWCAALSEFVQAADSAARVTMRKAQ
ncbi:hypothetical protein [Microbacterium trichothecenolyticum]|uniref:Uncharacterized protein n=1 Tax=Microbacterium trichothecenolyticum TaxID=69370 RepID=A0ABU0TX30_MICTR|nr:hypothetical protein [Microbacterium trichothecenolyticum]MDQ1124225.1 hypothetical protein [Microbacterium trichothecenolyticum]